MSGRSRNDRSAGRDGARRQRSRPLDGGNTEADYALRELRSVGRRYERARAALDRVVAERDAAIVTAAHARASRASIAAAAGITVIRVQQVLAAHGAVRPYRHVRTDAND